MLRPYHKLALLTLLVSTVTGFGRAEPRRYEVIEITPQSPCMSCSAHAINNRGAVAGSFWEKTAIAASPFVWAKGRTTVIRPPGSDGGGVIGINDAGMVIGAATYDSYWWWKDGQAHAFARNPDNTLSPYHFWPNGLNNKGQVVGGRWVWENGRLTDLGTLAGKADRPQAFGGTFAKAINNLGQVVGESEETPDGTRHAFLWEKGTMQALDTDEDVGSVALDINDSGVVVGTKGIGLQSRLVTWRSGNLEYLPLPTGYSWGSVIAINNRGQIIGGAQPATGESEPVLWENGQVYRINDLLEPGSGWKIEEVNDINDSGQIVGKGTRKGETSLSHAILLTPRPGKP